jgi:predicted unusual protein kinase regulating ubiquinone biosynthesis (AarF/ABC1/UbiB family)
MLEECDYVREAAAQESFRARLSVDPSLVIPRVHTSISTPRNMVSDRLRGASLAELAASAPPLVRNRAGETILRYVLRTAVIERVFNTDMHPGNLLFDEDGRVCIVDFGNVRRWSSTESDGWRVILTALVHGDLDELSRGFHMVGLADASAAFDAQTVHRLLVEHVMRAVVIDHAEPVDKETLLRELKLFGPAGPLRDLKLRISPPYVYGFRMYWGMFAVLADLGACVNWRRVVIDVLARAQASIDLTAA